MGLGIAVLCIIAHAILGSMSKRQNSDLEAFSLKLENLLAETAHGAGAQQR
jgi:biopolymer transport protein ExbB/TolQ